MDRRVGAPALDGLRVVAFEVAVAGPFATHMLADMGAEVIKVEPLGSGDSIRTWDSVVRGLSSGYVWLNRRKRSVQIDVSKSGGREAMCRLIDDADVFITNFGPGAAARLGFDYPATSARNPRLIYCALTGYGMDGPYKNEKAYDLLIQGESGVLLSTGYPDGPAKVSVPISDIAAGMYAALGVLIALYQRDRTGVGQFVDIAMFDSMLSWLGYFPQHYWHAGEEPARVGMRHHYMIPYGPFLACDGKYVNVAASAGHWESFCVTVLERPDLLADPRFASSPLRREHRAVLEPLIEQVFLTRDADEWLARLRAANVPCGEVRGMAEALAHPQVAARRLIREVESPVGLLPTIESPLRLSGSPIATGALPALGQDTEAVLRRAGYDDDGIKSLRNESAIP